MQNLTFNFVSKMQPLVFGAGGRILGYFSPFTIPNSNSCDLQDFLSLLTTSQIFSSINLSSSSLCIYDFDFQNLLYQEILWFNICSMQICHLFFLKMLGVVIRLDTPSNYHNKIRFWEKKNCHRNVKGQLKGMYFI